MAAKATTLSVPGPHGVREVRISSPDRVLWPESGFTKLDLANYMVAVGGAFTAANGDRPLSLQRFPGGINGEQFFSKNPPKGAPDYVRDVMVVYPSARSHPQLVIDEPAAAVWAVQMNTVVFHPWPSLAGDPDNPDQLRIDLDPQPGTDFDDAVPAAVALREVLAEAGLEAFIKTSGNRGLHVFAPIEPVREFQDVRHAVIAAARELERRMPDEVTTSWWKEERGEKVFVDFNQANRDRTMAGASATMAASHGRRLLIRSVAATVAIQASTASAALMSKYASARSGATPLPGTSSATAPASSPSSTGYSKLCPGLRKGKTPSARPRESNRTGQSE